MMKMVTRVNPSMNIEFSYGNQDNGYQMNIDEYGWVNVYLVIGNEMKCVTADVFEEPNGFVCVNNSLDLESVLHTYHEFLRLKGVILSKKRAD